MVHELSLTNDKKTKKRFVDVVNIVQLTDIDDIEVVLSIADFINSRFLHASILRTEISPESVRNLVLKKGGICRNAKHDCSYILKKVDALLLQNVKDAGHIAARHSRLGWQSADGELTFNGYFKYTKDGVANSVYVGNTRVKPCGSLDEFISMFNITLFDNVPMQAIMAMAAAATVLPFANLSWGTSFYNPTNHLLGNSTTGKTTGGCLFAAFGGAPEGTDSLMLSFLGTDNALVNQIGENHGYPIAIDEFSTGLSRKGWSDFGYTLANGRGKARCQAGGAKVQKIDEFSTVFLTTGEMSILRRCNNNEGLRARIFEYQIEDGWTRSAAESDMIKSVCRRNYGLITPLIAQELLRNSSHWQEVFEGWRKKVRDRIREEKLLLGIGDRVADFVALYVTASELLSAVLKVNMAIDAVFDFFFLHIIVKNAEDANLGTRVYESIIAYFAKNRHLYPALFPLGDDYIMEPETEGFVVDSQRGRTVGDKTFHHYVIFQCDVLDAMLIRNNFSDPKVALKALQKDGYLRTKDKSRLYIEKRINGITTRVYGVWVDISW